METILTAAIHYKNDDEYAFQPKNIETGFILCGYSHASIDHIVNIIFAKQKFDKTEGFLTSKNRFVSRQEASEIAYKAGQIDKPYFNLSSEILHAGV